IGVDRDLHFARVYLEDLQPTKLVRAIDQHLAIEASRTQERRVEDFGPVRCRDENEALRRIEAVHLDQKLVERLLFFVVSAQTVRAARATERVQLVDEDDRRSAGTRLLEKIAHARRADADEHLDELRAVDREERHARFARDCASEKRLARARRTDEQHALGNVSAETRIALGILEEADDFLQLF